MGRRMGPRIRGDKSRDYSFGRDSFFLWWKRRGKGERRFRQTGGSRTAPTVRPGDGSPHPRGHGEGVRRRGGGRRSIPWGSFAICEHLFHGRKDNRGCRLVARRSCHNGGIGSTPIPSASSGQALAFPHQRGKGFEGGEILRLRCAVLGIIWGERGGERWVPASARTRRGSGRPQGSPLRGAGRRGVKGCFLSLGGSDLILLE